MTMPNEAQGAHSRLPDPQALADMLLRLGVGERDYPWLPEDHADAVMQAALARCLREAYVTNDTADGKPELRIPLDQWEA